MLSYIFFYYQIKVDYVYCRLQVIFFHIEYIYAIQHIYIFFTNVDNTGFLYESNCIIVIQDLSACCWDIGYADSKPCRLGVEKPSQERLSAMNMKIKLHLVVRVHI